VRVTPRFRRALAVIAVAGLALTLVRLGRSSYGLEEVRQAFRIGGDWKFFWNAAFADVAHPPLDPLVDKLFQPLHPGDAARRVLPALWGAGGVAALGVLLARRGSPVLGLTSAAILAFAPYHVRISRELRPEALALFLLALALGALDRFLERPRAWRAAAACALGLGTAYTLPAAGLALAVAAGAMVLEDAGAPDAGRRRAARRTLAWSPLVVPALALACLPLWPAFRATAVPWTASPIALAPAARAVSFFAFAPEDGAPLTAAGWVFLLLAACGIWLAASRPGLRFLAAWALGGAAAIAVLGRVDPDLEGSRRFVAVGPALTALAAASIAAMISRPVARLAGVALLAAFLVLDARSLGTYFRGSAPDWRPLAEYLRREAAPGESIFAENRHTQLCLAYHLVGPRWLFDTTQGRDPGRSIVDVGGDRGSLARAWRPGTRGWLVLAAGPEDRWLRRWAASLPSQSFPTAAGATLHRLGPAGSPGR
jgi:4-amino-4-deoxy-L-arabinose transferase-like glycosyltransferase